ncbi:hypothetical protein OG889_22720 [Streptomyces sp. NBC_00481]|uniref:hypothetical protein n=1 Tax=Streptomyces sp. NBC_00481 TaxID=2975755 RepID=UPI002DDB74BA|nr:hypothetical protein [Streptomyces sp. NBC_00481]WRY97291.1 hypothetical protein OG889_22720 [Streptomyces sp. NBC_00481]
METEQRVVRRSGLFSRLLFALWCVALLLLIYTLIRQNLTSELARRWPWKLRLLDRQSAVAAVLATGGASLARAQYARTVRPMIGYFGRVGADHGPANQLAWACHMFNGGQDAAVVTEVSYRIAYASAARARGASDSSGWVMHPEAVASIERSGLVNREDLTLTNIGPGLPLSASQPLFMAWFAERALRDVENVFVKVRVLDRTGDTHERVINLLKGANRSPSHPDPPIL